MSSPRLAAGFLSVLLPMVSSGDGARAQVLEVIHPEVEKGGFELELLSGVRLDSVPAGDESGVYEFAIAYAPTDYWKSTIAFEIADPKPGAPELEAVELENLFLFHGAGGHGHDHDHDHGGETGLASAGIYTVLEIPVQDGIDDGAFAIGPVAEWGLGHASLVGNLLLEFPFSSGANTGLSYAAQLTFPVGKGGSAEYALGLEAHGGVDDVFDGGDFDDGTHFFGPAIYAAFDVGRGRSIEPRLGIFAGLGRNSPDAVASLNVEVKF